MFSDLTNNSKNAISINQVKAYPSVNSPNDGGFNSESNLRWIAKRFTSKPFITGQTQEDIENAFTSTGGAGDGTYIKPGMIALDGYTIKFAKQQNLDFDDEITDDSAYTLLNTQYLQRFAHTLTCQGTEYQLKTNLDEYVFGEYASTNDGTSYEHDQAWYWENANLNGDGELIGFICNTYENTFYNTLTIDIDNAKVTYGNTSIGINNSITYESSPEDVYTATSHTGIPLSCQSDTTVVENPKISIFFPVRVKNKKFWSKNTNTYVDSPIVYFTDIFGLTFERALGTSNSKVYPTTNSQFIDCADNIFLKPESQGGLFGVGFVETSGINTFDQYAPKTLTTETLNYVGFYDDNVRKYDIGSITPSSVSDLIANIKIGSDNLFTIIHISDILNNLNPQQITQINNTAYYYCLVVPVPAVTLDIANSQNIAFITSDGYLCPDGFATDGNVYPDVLEGYLHWLRRVYAVKKGVSLDSVTVDTLLSDWNTIKDAYNTYIAPAMCAYVNICYNSLVQYANDANANITDAQKIKSIACGLSLNKYLIANPQTSVFLSDNDLNFTQQIQYTGYSYDTDHYQEVNKTNSITYRKDITSDSDKLTQSVLTNTSSTLIPDPSNIGQDITEYSHISGDSKYVVDPRYIEDPINFFRRCSYNSNYENTITDVPIYTLNGTALSFNNTITMGTSSSTTVSFMLVDKFLMPTFNDSLTRAVQAYTKNKNDFVAYLTSHEMIQRYTADNPQTTTVANGMCLEWSMYTWYIQTPLVISLNKDALNYLIGRDVTNPGYYGGAEFGFRLPQDVTETDLQVAYLTCSTSNVIGSFDIETSDRSYDTISKDIRQHREPFIHFNKLYGDNFETLDDKINDLIDINMSDIQSQINDVNVTLGLIDTELNDETTGLSPRVSALETATADIPTIKNDISSIEENYVKIYSTGVITIQDGGSGPSDNTHIFINQAIQPGDANAVTATIDIPPDVPTVTPCYEIVSVEVYQDVQNSLVGFLSKLNIQYYVNQLTKKICFLITNNGSTNVTEAYYNFNVLVKLKPTT